MIVLMMMGCGAPSSTVPPVPPPVGTVIEPFDRLESPLVLLASSAYEMPIELQVGPTEVAHPDRALEVLNRYLKRGEPTVVRMKLNPKIGDELAWDVKHRDLKFRGAAMVAWTAKESGTKLTLVNQHKEWINFQPGGFELKSTRMGGEIPKGWKVQESLLHPDAGAPIAQAVFLGDVKTPVPEGVEMTIPALIEGAVWSTVVGTDSRWKFSVSVQNAPVTLSKGDMSVPFSTPEPGSITSTTLPFRLAAGANTVEVAWDESTDGKGEVKVELEFGDGIMGPHNPWPKTRRLHTWTRKHGDTEPIRVFVEDVAPLEDGSN